MDETDNEWHGFVWESSVPRNTQTRAYFVIGREGGRLKRNITQAAGPLTILCFKATSNYICTCTINK